MMTAVGRGWATVELDRAAEELADRLEPGGSFVDAPRSAILGAACRVGWGGGGAADAGLIVLLEPDTEGRLAAWLARNGEGWAAVWETDGDDGRAGREVGPLGRERLIEGSAATGPFRLLLSAATIER